MKSAHGGDDIFASCRDARKLEGCFHRLCAGITKEDAIQAGYQRCDLFHQHGALVIGECFEQSHQRIRLLIERLGNFRVGMTKIRNSMTG